MSLDVYLTLPHAQQELANRIFIREDGRTKEVSRAEWDARYPGREPATVEAPAQEVYSANITHNLGRMANEAGLYVYLWKPDECGLTHAKQLIEPLIAGLAVLQYDPERFRTFNPSKGWGDYDGLVSFVEQYLAACREYPDAEVSVSR